MASGSGKGRKLTLKGSSSAKGRRRKYSSRFKLNRVTGEITNEKRSTRA
nr:MAG TPA: hypothetical protein [Caudoviricetes sp.]DAO92669.1 MAG TPA: hypothetical protein [Caudoviricetes sp.]DAW64464.1 MAG TPA: hypothetical protein [Caudoviricetes sp.]